MASAVTAVFSIVIVGICCAFMSGVPSEPEPGHLVTAFSSRIPGLPWMAVATSTVTATTLTLTVTTTTPTTMTVTTTETPSSTETSTSTTRTTTTFLPYPSLFCFSVMRAEGYELSLVRSQLAQGASIFGCESWAVFSDVKTWLTPGPPVLMESTVLNTSLKVSTGRVEHLLNTEVFIQAFDNVCKDPRLRVHDWVVKIDPDAVFFPERLKQRIMHVAPARSGALYFRNCKAGFNLFGAIEVFSQSAMEIYAAGIELCKGNLSWREWGEDLWMRRCMDFLEVLGVDDFELLSDAYCGEQPSPCQSGRVAFHPFKAPETYFHCWREAKAPLLS